MKLARLILICSLAASCVRGFACTNTEWSSSVTEVLQVGQCTVSTCTFSFTESVTGASLSGTFTRGTTGFLVMTVGTKSAGTSTGWGFSGSTIYAVEVPGGALVVQPLIAEDLYNPVIMVSNQCPTQAFRANWIFGHWDPSGGSDVSSSSQPAAGYLDSSGTSNVLLSVRDMYDMSVFGSLGPLSLTPSGAVSCSGGKATINAGTGDRQGTVYYGGASNILLYKTAACHSVFAVPQTNIWSMAMLTGSYAGFAYDTKQNSGFDTAGASVHQVKVTINNAGCTSSSKCTGVGWTTGQVTDATYMNGGLSIQVNAINSPRTGMFTGYLFDGSSNRGNVLCTINRNWKTTGNTPPYYHNVFCVAQNPTTNSEPMNLFLVSVPAAPGTDTSYVSGTGYATQSVGTSDVTESVAIQPDGKILISGYGTVSTKPKAFIARYNIDGTLDTTFNSGGTTPGLVTFAVGTRSDNAKKVLIQTDGKLVAADLYQSSASAYTFAVTRYNSNGTLDTTYGTSGVTTSSFTGYSDAEVMGAVIQPDNKVILTGSCLKTSTSLYGFCAARYNVDGTLDSSFGATLSGFTYANLATVASNGSQAWRGKLLSNGKLLMVGRVAQSSTNFTWGIMRLNTDGTLDTTFNSAGAVPGTNASMNPTAFGDAIFAVDTQSDGKIVVGGYAPKTVASTTYNWAIGRYNSDGTIDTGFGTSGYVSNIIINANISEQVNDLIVQPDDKIVAVGSAANSSSKFTAAIVRYTSSGALDTTFNASGSTPGIYILSPSASQNTVAGAIALDGLGRIVIGGYYIADVLSFRLWP